MNWLRLCQRLAAPRVTVAFFLLTALGALAVALLKASATLAMALPFVMLVLNLVAAVISKPRFRADLPLLVFHLALLALVVLLVMARLVYYQGGVILTTGSAFDGRMVVEEMGPLHRKTLDRLHFQHEGFTDRFRQRDARNVTYNKVRWWDEAGESHLSVIGDDRPLLLGGYRIYATRRRGLSPLFAWQRGGQIEYGTVQLEDKGGEAFAPTAEWQLPGGPKVWVMVEVDRAPAQALSRSGNYDTRSLAHRLVLRTEQGRHAMQPGQTLALPGGSLTYVRLDSWMGYRLVSEPLMPWLVATVAVGVLALVWFYIRVVFWPRRGPKRRTA